VWAETARDLVLKHGPDHCLYYVELLPYQKGVRDAGAWLRRYVENGWPLKAPEELDGTSPTLPGIGNGTAKSTGAPEGGKPDGGEPRGPDDAAPTSGHEASGTAPPGRTKRGRDPDAEELFRALLVDVDGHRAPASSCSVRFENPDVALEGDILVLTVPNAATRDHAEVELRSDLERALRARLSPHAALEIRCPPAPPGREASEREFRRRRAKGEFERAIETFETLPYEEYRKWVGQSPTHPDGNRYHLTIDGDLFVYSGGSDPVHRHFLRRLDRRA
jgi:hypothetical protein